VTVPGLTGAVKAGGGGSEYSVVAVADRPPANQPPLARISSSCEGLTCSFDGAGSSDSDGAVVSHAWSFGDGSESTAAAPTRTYAAAGTYTVALTVTDDDGDTGATEVSVTVDEPVAASVAYRAGAATDANSAQPAVVVPSAVTPGDLLLLMVTTNRAATATTPAGWALAGTASDGVEMRSWVYSRTAAAGTAGSTVRIGLDAVSKTSLTLLAYDGAAGVSALTSSAEGTASTTGHSAPGASAATAGAVVRYFADKTSSPHGWTAPAGTQRRTQTTGSGGGLLTSVTADQLGHPAGPVAAATAVAAVASAKAVAWTVVLQPR
jgi:PKD repeat protein